MDVFAEGCPDSTKRAVGRLVGRHAAEFLNLCAAEEGKESEHFPDWCPTCMNVKPDPKTSPVDDFARLHARAPRG